VRHPSEIATEMESLAEPGDPESSHGRADDLLLELIEGLKPSREQAPPVTAAVDRAVAAWRRGAKGWWWA
jgi:hypothetical protein